MTDSYIALSRDFLGDTLIRDLRHTKIHSVYPTESTYFDQCYAALLDIEYKAVHAILRDMKRNGVSGAFAEFGIFQGAWIERLFQMTTVVGLQDRAIYGLDSFKGLSKPHEEYDTEFWKEGMYEASKSDVEQRLKIRSRPRIKLIEGYFDNSLKTKEAESIGECCFARIDCDIYEPARQSLDFLSHRLSHGAVLVFDDWTHDYSVGEGRAFAEWVPTVPHLQFKFLFLGPWDHLYLRVLHRGKSDKFLDLSADKL
jgi:hypothetical protein